MWHSTRKECYILYTSLSANNASELCTENYQSELIIEFIENIFWAIRT